MRKKAIAQEFPTGWNEKKVREVIAYYDSQTDEEGAAEIEAAEEVMGETWMAVPTELVPAVARLIDKHERKPSNTKKRKRKTNNGRLGRKTRRLSAAR